jgi:methylphosphotriester-DNA--protein-cysteine methyltransferase
LLDAVSGHNKDEAIIIVVRLVPCKGSLSPQQVAKTRRVQRAKRLLDETDDTLAGFGSVRRFNATLRELYGRSPSSIRRRKAR